MGFSERLLAVRGMWSDFQKKDPICIKTVADFEAFEVFAKSALSLDADARKNLRKAQPDLARLRLSLCQAWASSRAGFTYGLDGDIKKISAAEFAKHLSDCGIPCQRTDVENARKKANFIAKSCPPTRRCMEAFETLKQRIPPSLPATSSLTVVGHCVPLAVINLSPYGQYDRAPHQSSVATCTCPDETPTRAGFG